MAGNFFFNFSHIRCLRSLNISLDANKTFLYLTKNDFIKAFGDRTMIVAKDFQTIKLHFNADSESLLLKNQKNLAVKSVEILGDVLRPTELKLVNTNPKQDSDSSLLFCLDEMTSDDGESQKSKSHPKRKRCAIGQSLNINLFRRRMKVKKFLEMEESEKTELATVLDFDKFKDKSLFHYINEKKLVEPLDYEEPDFLPLS